MPSKRTVRGSPSKGVRERTPKLDARMKGWYAMADKKTKDYLIAKDYLIHHGLIQDQSATIGAGNVATKSTKAARNKKPASAVGTAPFTTPRTKQKNRESRQSTEFIVEEDDDDVVLDSPTTTSTAKRSNRKASVGFDGVKSPVRKTGGKVRVATPHPSLRRKVRSPPVEQRDDSKDDDDDEVFDFDDDEREEVRTADEEVEDDDVDETEEEDFDETVEVDDDDVEMDEMGRHWLDWFDGRDLLIAGLSGVVFVLLAKDNANTMAALSKALSWLFAAMKSSQ